MNTPGYTLFKKYNVPPRRFRLELLPFRRGVKHRKISSFDTVTVMFSHSVIAICSEVFEYGMNAHSTEAEGTCNR